MRGLGVLNADRCSVLNVIGFHVFVALFRHTRLSNKRFLFGTTTAAAARLTGNRRTGCKAAVLHKAILTGGSILADIVSAQAGNIFQGFLSYRRAEVK